MRESTIPAVVINLQIPDYSCKQNYWRLNKEVSLLLNPASVKVQHDGIGRFICIRYVSHEIGINRVTPMTSSWIIEVDYIKCWFYLVTVGIFKKMIISYFRQIRKLIIVYIHSKRLLNLLFDEVVYHCIRLP